jgi:hypothetical protein
MRRETIVPNGIWPPPWMNALAAALTGSAAAAAFSGYPIVAGILATGATVLLLAMMIGGGYGKRH